MTTSERHGVITSYAGLFLSLIAIVLSVLTMYQSHVMETREIVQILRVEDDGYYHFDGEKLFKNFQVTVANNSAISTSVVEITIERDGEERAFEVSKLLDILPLNMEANHTEMITIPWEVELSPENAQKINEVFEQDSDEEPLKADTVYPSRGIILDTKNIPDVTTKNGVTISDWAGNCVGLTLLLDNSSSNGDTTSMWAGNCVGLTIPSTQFQEIPLSITVFTAKDNRFSLKGKDQKPAIHSDEGTWVANRITTGALTLSDFIDALRISQSSDTDSTQNAE
ncbi:MAG: hypothetical protein IJR54_09310 [Oscillibacter sp.]|nr:hypothetical protein [Oscillibacter sp.]